MYRTPFWTSSFDIAVDRELKKAIRSGKQPNPTTMLKNHYLLVIAFCLLGALNASAQEKFFVAFCAKKGVPGHAFISYGYESEDLMMTIHGGTWGQYPKDRKMGGTSFLIGEIPGGLRDDMLTTSDHTFVIEATQEEYEAVNKVKESWADRPYELTKSDCVSFLIEVAFVFEGRIHIPIREGLENLPAHYLSKLIEVNN